MIPLLLAARSLRAFADGYVAVLLPAYLLALGHGQIEVGILSTVALLGSALATLAVGRWGQRFAVRRLLLGAALVMLLTGLGFATLSALWPLLIVAFIGPLNPSAGDVSVFLPLEHTMLAASAPGDSRITVFARYSFFGSIFGAVGSLAAAVPDWLAREAGVPMLDALRAMFALYAVIGAVVWALYLRLPRVQADANLSASDPPKANAASSANSATSNSVAFNSASPNSASSNSAGSASEIGRAHV